MDIILHQANSLEQIKHSWEKGVRLIEVDVWVSRDNKIVLSHDNRAFDKKRNKIAISDFPYKQLYDENQDNLSLLSNALKELRNTDRKIFIEVKCGTEIIDPLNTVLKKYQQQTAQIRIIGFIDSEKNKNTMKMIAEQYNEYDVYALFGSFEKGKGDLAALKNMTNTERVSHIVNSAEEINAKGIVVRFNLGSDRLYEEAGNKGFARYVWDVNDTVHLPGMLSHEIDGVITDNVTGFQAELDLISR